MIQTTVQTRPRFAPLAHKAHVLELALADFLIVAWVNIYLCNRCSVKRSALDLIGGKLPPGRERRRQHDGRHAAAIERRILLQQKQCPVIASGRLDLIPPIQKCAESRGFWVLQ
jgi:hypothetical protein